MSLKENSSDVVRFFKAVLTNQIARFFPKHYLQMTGQTGRGDEEENATEISSYFLQCFEDYQQHLGFDEGQFKKFLENKHILEYGPGDLPGVAFLFYAYGAHKVTCVDRFPMVVKSQKNMEVLNNLLSNLTGDAQNRGAAAFNVNADPASGFRKATVDYLVSPNGFSGFIDDVDLIISRAVLEHVNDLDGTFMDMAKSMKQGSLAIHQIDFKSHGLHKNHKLDFLAWSNLSWRLMYSQKGVPNRLRQNSYISAANKCGLKIDSLKATEMLDKNTVDVIRQDLNSKFKDLPYEDLSCLGCWMLLEK